MVMHNIPMTAEQLEELMSVAVQMQRDSEKVGEREVSIFAYAVQVAVSEIRKVREELRAAHSTIEKAREVTKCPQGVDLQDHLMALVAESLAMKSAAKEVLAHWAAAEPGEMEQMMDKCMPDLRVAYCETPATDSILRAAEARGVEKFAAWILRDACGDKESQREVGEVEEAAESFAAKLREGKA